MITLKELSETGNNKEEINGSTENYEKHISECGGTSDNLDIKRMKEFDKSFTSCLCLRKE